MTRPLVLEELIAAPQATPFEASPSYRNDWWTRPDAPRGVNVRYFELREGRTDVTRVRLFDPSTVRVALEDFDSSMATMEVDRIETRAERRREGFGLHALNLLRERFDTHQFVAFSHQDDFWSETGFEPRYRQDGRTAGTATVFVAQPLR